MRKFSCAFILIVSSVLLCAQITDFGHFSGNPKLEWSVDGRLMTLLEDFFYYDPSHEVWAARKGEKTDGASIPQAFWWLIGGPYEGKYRNAAIVHDSECAAEPHRHGWREVHRMFYNASRAGGVSESKAKVMFMAVYFCGPRWEWRGEKATHSCPDRDTLLRGVVVIQNNPTISLDAIEAFTAKGLESQTSDADLKNIRERINYELLNGRNRTPFGELQ